MSARRLHHVCYGVHPTGGGTRSAPLPAYLQDDLLIQLEGDYSEGAPSAQRTLEVTAETVRVRETNGVVAFQIPIAEIKEARNEPLVGGGRLEITAKNGRVLPDYHLFADRLREVLRGGARHRAVAEGRAALHQSQAGAHALRQMQPPAAGKGRHLPGLRQPQQDAVLRIARLSAPVPQAGDYPDRCSRWS